MPYAYRHHGYVRNCDRRHASSLAHMGAKAADRPSGCVRAFTLYHCGNTALGSKPLEGHQISSSSARLAGGLYLGAIVGGLFAEVVSRGSLIVGRDAAATAHAIVADQPLFRAGLLADTLMLACYIGVTVLFNEMFRPVHSLASKTAAAYSLIGIAVLAADTLLLLAPLRLLAISPYPMAVPLAERESLALLAVKIHGDGYDLSLVFFGVYCLMLGWLVWRSGFLPKFVGALMTLAGICYLGNSIVDLGAPAIAQALSPHLMDPTLIGEAALALWLLIFGANGSFRDRPKSH